MLQNLLRIFPEREFALLGVIILLPLLGAIVNGIFGKRIGKEGVTLMALASVGGSFIASVFAFLGVRAAQTGDEPVRFYWKAWEWIRISGKFDLVSIPLDVKFSVDALSATMALVVTGVGFLIHLYSTSYMAKDPGYHRFFAYLNLFIFSMLVLILGNSLPILFVGWEGVGLCSYLLIGFWFEEEKNAQAGKKAFITNRIGDFGLLVAMGLLIYYVGALDWDGIEGGRKGLLQPVQLWPIGNQLPGTEFLAQKIPALAGAMKWLNSQHYCSAATLVGLALFLGCAGKSAQIPLYVWLPDAMAGPTPVSALIHAATMVTAGVYLVCRMAGVFVLSPAAMFFIALIGALTALLAATIAFVQNDIKKVLAYSTVSQLGYMFLGVGVGAFTAGFFHVITHAFFKACLFLGAGSVIYAMHKRIHDVDGSQDMRNMGGMKKYMPITFYTFVAAWVAIIGFPLTAGFFSKDEILYKAYVSGIASPVVGGKLTSMTGARSGITVELTQWPTWGGKLLFAMGVIGAIMTAFYMSRLVFGIFWGDFKGWTIVKKWKEPEHDHHDDHHHDPDEPLEGPTPKESPWQMTLPLCVLGGLAIVGGFLNAHLFHITPLENFLEPVFKLATGDGVGPGVKEIEGAKALEKILIVPGVIALVIGAGAAYWVYVMKQGEPARALAEAMPRTHELAMEKWRVDEAYDDTIIGAVDSLANGATIADKVVVDGIVARLTSFIVATLGSILRLFQTGHVQAYAAVMVVGIGGLGWFFTAPHADAIVTGDANTGIYSLNAGPGLGYQYRWDLDGDGKPDSEAFANDATQQVNVERGKQKSVVLEVKNSFGRVAKRTIVVKRPELDKTGAPGNTVIQVQQDADGNVRGNLPGSNRPLRMPRPQMPGMPGMPGAPGGPAGVPPGAQPGRPGMPPPGMPPGQPMPNPRMGPPGGPPPGGQPPPAPGGPH
jgi:NADH-quinone oxidoreductase subunit L